MHTSNEIHKSSTSIDLPRLLGGRLCLDYINTIEPRMGKQRQDFLTSYLDLVRWSRHAEVLTEDEAENLLRKTKDHPAEAILTFERSINLRETIYRTFSTITQGGMPETGDMDRLQGAFAGAMTHAQIIPADNGFKLDWKKNEDALDRMLWPIIRSTVELLTSSEVKRVKECPGAGDCGWLFLDTSKNGSRQWCSMEGCGSRVKMRRHYARKRAIGHNIPGN